MKAVYFIPYWYTPIYSNIHHIESSTRSVTNFRPLAPLTNGLRILFTSKKNKSVTDFNRNSVIALYLARKSQPAIVRELKDLKVHKVFIYHTITHYKITSSNVMVVVIKGLQRHVRWLKSEEAT